MSLGASSYPSGFIYCVSISAFAGFLSGGVANYVDGNIIMVAGAAIRLNGIDSPEYRQKCENKVGKRYS